MCLGQPGGMARDPNAIALHAPNLGNRSALSGPASRGGGGDGPFAYFSPARAFQRRADYGTFFPTVGEVREGVENARAARAEANQPFVESRRNRGQSSTAYRGRDDTVVASTSNPVGGASATGGGMTYTTRKRTVLGA